ncbi:MAG TPA: hypothetical protein VE994_11915 [Terriglobales bacterium]|nr:hypothetical protein [Terriglobales bacterium]
MNDWPRWQVAVLVNASAVTGIALSLVSADAKGLQYGAGAGVFIIAFVNFMFFVVRLNVLAARTGGAAKVPVMPVLLRVIREQPLVLFIAVLLLVGSLRSAVAAVSFAHWSGSAYVHGLPIASVVAPRMVAISVMMTGVALLWFIGAVGLWARRRWAWLRALVLNGLSAGLSAILQVLNWRTYLLDIFATAALILLLLPRVRRVYGHPAASC